MPFSRDLGERYSPLYFFNAFAAGGLAITFFMYLFWMARSTMSAYPTANVLYSLIVEMGIAESVICLASIAGCLFFTAQHVLLVRWNFNNFTRWKRTQTYAAFAKSSDKTILMTIPLTLSLSVLLGLIILCTSLPFILVVIEFVLGAALAAFGCLGWWAVKIYSDGFFAKTNQLQAGEEPRGNNLGQMTSILCFLVISLGFALISATSMIKFTLFMSYIAALFFMTLAGFIGLIWFVPRLGSLHDKRLPPESASLLWFAVSLLCTFFLSWHYLNITSSSAFGGAYQPAQSLCSASFVLAACILFGLFGRATLAGHGLLEQLIKGKIYAAGLYAVVCPATLLIILGHYLINILVQTGLLLPWSFYYFLFYVPLLALQVILIRLYTKLNAKLFSSKP